MFMNRMRPAILALAVCAATASAAEKVYDAPPAAANPAATPRERDDWLANVQQKFTRYGSKPADIVFDGDSITNRWELTGRTAWTERYAKRAANFGIEGDRTEQVLWRLSKGQLDGVNPKVVVLMIGTNNLSRHTVEQVAGGVGAVVTEYRKRCPAAHLIVTGILPRGAKSTDPLRVKLNEVNAIIARLADGRHVSYVDIGPKLLEADGSISPKTMPDFLHPVARAYDIWADAIQPIIDAHLPPAQR